MWRVSVLQMWRQAMATRGTACKAVNVMCRLASMQAAITGALPQLTCNMSPFRVSLKICFITIHSNQLPNIMLVATKSTCDDIKEFCSVHMDAC